MRDSKRRLAQQLYELFNERDIDALIELAVTDVEWDWSRSIGPDAGVYHGARALRRFVCASWEHWDALEMVPEEILEAAEEVVVLLRVRLRGRDGIEVEARGPHVQSVARRTAGPLPTVPGARGGARGGRTVGRAAPADRAVPTLGSHGEIRGSVR